MHAKFNRNVRAAARKVAALLAFFVALAASSCGDPYVQGGAMHFDAMRYDRAAAAFEEAVAKNPKDASARLWLARCYAELNRIPEAVLQFDQAATLSPSLAPEVSSYRLRYWRAQELRGESLLREALVMPETSAQRTERLNQAAAALQQALLLSTDSGITYFQLHKLHAARGESTEALKYLGLALDRAQGDEELSGELVPILRERGRQAILDRDYQVGVTEYASAARLRPGDVDLQMDLASALLLLAESRGVSTSVRDSTYREAGRVLEEVHRRRPLEPDAMYNLATVRIRMKDYSGAGHLLLKYLALLPRDAEAWRLYSETAKAERLDGEARTAGLAAAVMALNRPVSDTGEWARRAAERFGPVSPLGAFFAELGTPDEIHTTKEGNQSLIEVWFHIGKRRVAAFQNGKAVGSPLRLGEIQ